MLNYMIMKKIVLLCLVAAFISACNKVTVSTPNDFNVSTTSTTFTTKDTILFTFSGTPDEITFYSGEPNRRYVNRARTSAQQDSTLLNFSTTTTAPSAITQPVSSNNVAVLVSTNYSGILDAAHIKSATWTDISARAKFAATTTAVASGNVHLEDLQAGSSSLYVAFKYIADTCTATSVSRKWTITPLTIKSYFKDTTNILASSIETGAFSNIYSILNSNNTWVFANTSLTFNAPAIGSSKDEDWAISRPMNLSLISPDLGVVIKNTSVRLPSYKYMFKKPGTYLVTFLAQNITYNSSANVVKQLTLTIN
jgi:hypothetical protein